MEKEKEKGKKKRKGKGKEKGRWKEDSLRNVGRTDARTLSWFYTLSNAMHCIGQTIKRHKPCDGKSDTMTKQAIKDVVA